MSPDKAPPPSPERAAVEPQVERAAKSATKGWSWRRKGSPANRKESLDWSSTIKFRADGAATKATNAAKNQQPPNTTPPEAERSTGGSFWARNGAAIRRYTAEKRQKAALLKIRSAKLQRDFREKLRTMLLAHIGAMREEGLGREFIQIDGTEPFCDLYPGPLKPTDELIAYDDTIIVEPRTTSFDKLRDAIAHSPRPLKLTFIEGERRDEAFREQEERRSMARNDVRIRCNREALAAAHAAQVVAHADAHGRVNASCEAALHSIPPDDDDDADAEYAGALLPAVGAADDPGLAAAAAPFFGPPPPPPRPAPPPTPRRVAAPRAKAPSVARAERAVARLERALDDADGALATPARRRPAPSVPVTHSATWQRPRGRRADDARTWQATLEGADPALAPPQSPWFAAQAGPDVPPRPSPGPRPASTPDAPAALRRTSGPSSSRRRPSHPSAASRSPRSRPSRTSTTSARARPATATTAAAAAARVRPPPPPPPVAASAPASAAASAAPAKPARQTCACDDCAQLRLKIERAADAASLRGRAIAARHAVERRLRGDRQRAAAAKVLAYFHATGAGCQPDMRASFSWCERSAELSVEADVAAVEMHFAQPFFPPQDRASRLKRMSAQFAHLRRAPVTYEEATAFARIRVEEDGRSPRAAAEEEDGLPGQCLLPWSSP
ncbi:hypothetical protein JL722_9297 [Aureococcus anophagefferens]|nr:hypothetical protein JL722_9297 [Aureococcus anophagefferens]